MLRHVLVPLDGRPAMAEVIPALRGFIGGTGAQVHLLVVRPPPRTCEQRGDRVVYLDELVLEERARWQDYLRRCGSSLAYDGVVVRREVRFGEPVQETLAAAHERRVPLIALAEPPQSWLAHLVRPNLTRRLLAQTAVPVLVIPPRHPLQRAAVLRYRSA